MSHNVTPKTTKRNGVSRVTVLCRYCPEEVVAVAEEGPRY
jgi:hypothetical protein